MVHERWARLHLSSYAQMGAGVARWNHNGCSSRLARVLSQKRDASGLPDLEVMGPSPAYLARLRGRYRWQVLVRGRRPAELLADVALPQNWVLDIDPATLA